MADDDEPKLMFLGRNLLHIPCFRRSILYGLGGGVGIGLVAFLVTSRPSLATKIAVGSYCTIAMTFFIYCRYDHMIIRRNGMLAEQLFREQGYHRIPQEVEKQKKLDA